MPLGRRFRTWRELPRSANEIQVEPGDGEADNRSQVFLEVAEIGGEHDRD